MDRVYYFSPITNHPEDLVPWKYNLIAFGGDDAAILWKDGKHFAIGTMEPWTQPVYIQVGVAFGFLEKGSMKVLNRPIPLEDLSEWRNRVIELAAAIV